MGQQVGLKVRGCCGQSSGCRQGLAVFRPAEPENQIDPVAMGIRVVRVPFYQLRSDCAEPLLMATPIDLNRDIHGPSHRQANVSSGSVGVPAFGLGINLKGA